MKGAESATACREATQIFDAVDRWRVANRFGITDGVHQLTRVQIFQRLENEKPRTDFRHVVAAMERIGKGDTADTSSLPVINYANFINDGGDAHVAENWSVLGKFAGTTHWLKTVVGNFCPYVRPSLSKNRIWMTTGLPSEASGEALYQLLLRAREAFRKLGLPSEEKEAKFNALVVLLPIGGPEIEVYDTLHGIQEEGNIRSFDGVTGAPFIPRRFAKLAAGNGARNVPPVFAFRHEMPKT
jgi:hypothetical protein